METVSILSFCLTTLLIIERIYKYSIEHIHLKRSRCCGGQGVDVEFE